MLLVMLTAAAFTIRWRIAFNGGLWADEASFLQVVRLPGWNEVLSFLRLHESHPPLFYAVMRIWIGVAGAGDVAIMSMPVMIAALLVPAVFLVGKSLYSTGTGLLASSVAAFSAPMTEQSAQLRPYGLMSLLVLVSCFTMVMALRDGRRAQWIGYAVTSTLLVYTHNWAWLVIAGQQVAVAILLLRLDAQRRRIALMGWIAATTAIAIAYSPWIPAFIYQFNHAGHAPVALEGAGMKFDFVVFSIFRIVETYLLGHLGDRRLISLAAGIGACIAAVAATAIRARHSAAPASTNVQKSMQADFVFTVVPVAALTLAIVFSPRSDLLLARCIITVLPLLILVFSGRCMALWRSAGKSAALPVAAGILAMSVITSAYDLYILRETRRTNAVEVADLVKRSLRASDLLLVTPEWYAPSFDHYFPPTVEQIDYPHDGRVRIVSFSDVWKRAIDPAPFAKTSSRVTQAKRDGRRVWLVLSIKYLTPVKAEDAERAYRKHHPGTLHMLRTQQLRALIEEQYGAPDSSVTSGPWKPTHDELRAYLYSPEGSAGKVLH